MAVMDADHEHVAERHPPISGEGDLPLALVAYERFLELPVPVVLAVLWLLGATLIVGLGWGVVHALGSLL